ncbi:flippase-like domain-containing protein [Defluviimonas sp. WL0024]|uniref:Flippase-like domain-containing protein n=1 Tax=Albidovulum salinarum TaxID=2984153 RepID=A0ABT2X6Q7_9RHOB|nr:lysylphosphatidylglycerol synthase transmembrane domain-containing protein [Defluviimonas sp. WL0024]MCU9849593.1 flippase-like domain-containing protein [Defluviimonas sp. WL0024]
MTRGTGRALRKWAIRAGGSALALALIFSLLPREAIFEGFARLTWPLFLSVFASFLVCHVAAAAKWWWLMDRAIGFPAALRAHFGGLAANLCLPGAAGGDAVRAGLAHVALRDGPRVAAAAVGDRTVDLVALVCLMLVGLTLIGGAGSGGFAIAVAGGILAAASAGLFLLPPLVRALWRRWPRLPARDLALRTAEAFAALTRRPGVLLAALALSVSIQAALIGLSIQLALVVGVNVPVAAWFFAWPLAKIIATLPVSLGGLGVRESSLAALLAPFGAAAAEVVASGLAWQGILYLAGALGALVLALSGGSFRTRPSAIKEMSE